MALVLEAKKKLLAHSLSSLLSFLDKGLLDLFADRMLDWIENKVLGSASKIDDRLILPICKGIRSGFNIPDNDEPKPPPGGSGGELPDAKPPSTEPDNEPDINPLIKKEAGERKASDEKA